MRFRQIGTSFLVVTESIEEQDRFEATLKAHIAAQAKPVEIDPADILLHASATVPFAAQEGYHLQALGAARPVQEIPEEGIKSTQLQNGDSLRFGKTPDPKNPARRVLLLQVHKNDKTTSGGKRCELRAQNNIEHDKVYWIAFSAYVYDWGELSKSDEAVFGVQLHQGNDALKVGGPAFGLYTRQTGRVFRVRGRFSESPTPSADNAKNVEFADQPMPFDRWADFVLKFKQNTKGEGLLQAWMDGAQIADYQGSLGYTTGQNDYIKFGYYNWSLSAMGSSPRKVLLRSPVVVADRAGYTHEILRAFVTKE